jgi:hypothetical protein
VHLRGLTQLEGLNLRETKITEAGLVHLRGLRKLKQLHLDSKRITGAGLAKLKAVLPSLVVD